MLYRGQPVDNRREMESVDLAARLALNPHNIGGIDGATVLSPHELCRARFEAEGRAAYPTMRFAPYNPGTMAAECWTRGFNMAASADPDSWEARRAAYRAGAYLARPASDAFNGGRA